MSETRVKPRAEGCCPSELLSQLVCSRLKSIDHIFELLQMRVILLPRCVHYADHVRDFTLLHGVQPLSDLFGICIIVASTVI